MVFLAFLPTLHGAIACTCSEPRLQYSTACSRVSAARDSLGSFLCSETYTVARLLTTPEFSYIMELLLTV